MNDRLPFTMLFDVGTIKHLGLQMYSTLPSVVGELVANAWDANATEVSIQIPDGPIEQLASEITIEDNGIGMTDDDIRERFMIVGRDRREIDGHDLTPTPCERKVMGRKGIGKFSAFGIAREVDVESIKDGETSRFVMNYDEMLKCEADREIKFPVLGPTGTLLQGTKITLRTITKYHNRSIALSPLRRRLARRFSVIGTSENFEVAINDEQLSVEDRDLRRLLDEDKDRNPYIWEYDDEEIQTDTGWTVSGWIGTLSRTSANLEDIDTGIALMARGKLVQEPFVFNAVVGQQYALSYLVGELHVEFVDELEDTIGTSRNSLVWETEANGVLLKWGHDEVNKIARDWAKKRKQDNEAKLAENALYIRFCTEAKLVGSDRAFRLADQLVRQVINNNPLADLDEIDLVIRTSLDFLRFDAFWDLVEDVIKAEIDDIPKLIGLFREWQIVEAKEMSRITEGRITTITKLQALIDRDAMEVPTLHNFLKEFPWVIDPRWTLVDDEVYYSQLLKERFSESDTIPESNRRIDFLCVGSARDLYVVEIKRPSLKASRKDLDQIENYVIFIRGEVAKSTSPQHGYTDVIGYLICGDMVNTTEVQGKSDILRESKIYVRLYRDLLSQVREVHKDFLGRYERLQQAQNM